MFTSITRACTLLALLVVSACGGGGGGAADGPLGGGPGPNGTATGLVPAVPALGAVLYTDATSLRPLRDKAVWTYTGTFTASAGATPVAYTTTTTHAAAADGSVTEAFSNAGNDGVDSAAVRIVAGTVSSPQDANFSGKGAAELIDVVELRSPVRQGDQYTALDKRFTDTNIDIDTDGKTDTLDVAIYTRVIGNETVALPNLPSVTAVLVEQTFLSRVLLSRTAQFTDPVQLKVQTWYAPGLGVVRQRTESPGAQPSQKTITDELLKSWDGITQGFGALAMRKPTPAELQDRRFSGNESRVLTFPEHALYLGNTLVDGSALALRYDKRGQLLGSQVVEQLRLWGGDGFAPLKDGFAVLGDFPFNSSSETKRLRFFNSDGSYRTGVGEVTVQLGGGKVVLQVNSAAMLGDGDRVWLFWGRTVRDPSLPRFPIVSEWVLRPYSAQGLPLEPERLLDFETPTQPKAVMGKGKIFFVVTGPEPAQDLVVASYDTASRSMIKQVVYPDAPGAIDKVTPVALDAGLALVWSYELKALPGQPFTSVLRLDAGLTPVRGLGSPPEMHQSLPAWASDRFAFPTVGAQMIFVAATSTENGFPRQFTGQSSVSWLDLSASSPLNTAAVHSVRFDLSGPAGQAVYPDRVIVFGGDGSATLVWSNNGKANP
jgi:hypothetical protein